MLGGWVVKTPALDAKVAFGLQMHRAMERATALRSRVKGLCHATAEDATVASGLRSVVSHIDRAQTPDRFAASVYRWLYPRLTEGYKTHLRQTDPDGDRASIDLIRSFLPAIEEERRDGRALSRVKRRGDATAWLRELDELWTARTAGEPLTLENALWDPVDRARTAARPAWSQLSESGSLGLVAADPVGDEQDVGMFLHKELDEEYTALELIARNSYEHPDMPWAFHRDMARHASDEARHAIMITRLMTTRGFRHGDFAVSVSSYEGLYEFEPCAPGSRKELLWRMLIRQTFMEGLAIDNLAFDIERRRAAGQSDIADVLEYILRDEVFHAQSGLRWSRELLGPEPDAILRARQEAFTYFTARAEAAREAFVINNLDEAMRELAAVQAGKLQRGGTHPDHPLNHTGRAQAGYTDADLRQVVSWGYASEKTGTA